ncbi:MAG: helix-turn-helix domain-containing protein [Lachnospiraceae bacterium]
MGNPNLLPYETIVRVTSEEPETVDEVIQHYSKRIRIAAIENGHIDRDTEDSITQLLIAALFKFRFDWIMALSLVAELEDGTIDLKILVNFEKLLTKKFYLVEYY